MTPRPANPEVVDRLVAAGQELVLRQGLAATSIDQVCRQAAVSKGSFFHYFATKQELVEELLRRYGSERMAFMAHGPERAMDDPRERLFAYLERIIEGSGDEDILCGCLMGNIGQEVSRCNPGLREIIAGGVQVWTDLVAADLAAAKRIYAPRATWQPKDVARHLIGVFQGGLLLVRITGDASALRNSLEHYARYVGFLLAYDKVRKTRRKRKGRS